MSKASFEFQIKRGRVNTDDADDDIKALVQSCIELCKDGNFEAAAADIISSVSFEWSWGSCDGDPSDIFEDPEDLAFDCDSRNSTVQVGEEDGNLILTVTVSFVLDVRDGVTQEEIGDWLSENSAFSCGYVSGGWSYSESDGDNISVTSLV